MVRCWQVVLFVLSWAVFAVAQSSDIVEVFGGYAYMNPDFSQVDQNGGPSGWDASVSFNTTRWIRAVADFSGFYSDDHFPGGGTNHETGQAYTFLFGPQFSFPVGRFSPFARFLVGAAHVTPQLVGEQSSNAFQSPNALALAAGGGVDCYISRHVGVRGQADWIYARLTPLNDEGGNYNKRNVARIAAGLVFRF